MDATPAPATAPPAADAAPAEDPGMGFQNFADGAAAPGAWAESEAATGTLPAGGADADPYAEATAAPGEGAAPQDVKTMVVRHFTATKTFVVSSYRGLRSWREFGDKTKFNVPTKMEAFERAKINLVYFKSNYAILLLLLSVWTILSNLTFTVSMCVTAVAWKTYLALSENGKKTVTLPGGRALSPLEAYSVLSFTTLALFYFTGGSSTIFWLIATAMIVILGHSTMREAAATATELALETLQAAGGAEAVEAQTNWV